MCRRILDLANSYGARAVVRYGVRTVVEDVETWADFLAVRELGFDLVQGFLFARPVAAEQFARTCWTAARHCLPLTRSLSERELPFPPPTHLCSKRNL
jgi:EAL domain-containing protein (putative c-di-GMP-specific phosphodiesterase class I)